MTDDAAGGKKPKNKHIRLLKIRRKLPKLFHLTPLAKLVANKKVRIGAYVVAGAAVLAALGWWGWSNSSLSKLSVSATLVEGVVEYRLDDAHPWERIQEGMSFGQGAQLRTLDTSRAAFRIDNGSFVRLNSNTSIKLAGLAPRYIVIKNTDGDVYARAAGSSKHIFEIQSDSTIYHASGGAAYRVFSTKTKNGVETYYGAASTVGAKNTTVVEQGERYFIRNTAAPDLSGKLTELVHADLVADAFVTWNGEQDRKYFEHELGVLSDLTPPALNITTPSNGITTEAISIAVKGTVEKGAMVRVNNAAVDANNGQFTTMISLREGANTIKVEAIDQAENTTIKELTINRTTPTQPTIFSLNATISDKGILFRWDISNLSIDSGFKLLADKTANPAYPGAKNVIAIDSTARTYTWGVKDGQVYHVRACTFSGETCTAYSNDITVTAPSNQ